MRGLGMGGLVLSSMVKGMVGKHLVVTGERTERARRRERELGIGIGLRVIGAGFVAVVVWRGVRKVTFGAWGA
jgi:hypothetical protein